MNGKIYIPKPCHENWDAMESAEKGRHCGVCSKVVTDFTNMETPEIIRFLQNSKTEVCGHIKVKEITPSNSRQNFQFWFKRLLPKLKVGLAAVIPFLFFKNNMMAQIVEQPIMNGGLAYDPQPTDSRKINIKVVDRHEVPVPEATIFLEFENGAAVEWTTDKNGKASNEINLLSFISTVNIKIIANGFIDKELKDVPVRKKEQSLEIVMDEELLLLGNIVYNPIVEEEVVIIPAETTCVEVPADSSDKINTPQELSVESMFLLYPNPTSGLVKIKTGYQETFDVVVLDSKGANVFSILNCLLSTEFDLGTQANGNYSVVILVGGRAIETHKIILVK